MPRHLPSVPTTPASSSTSRIAVLAGSSFGSTPPPGTIQLFGLRDDVTNSTWRRFFSYNKKLNKWKSWYYTLTIERRYLLRFRLKTWRICKQLSVEIRLYRKYALNLVFLSPFSVFLFTWSIFFNYGTFLWSNLYFIIHVVELFECHSSPKSWK